MSRRKIIAFFIALSFISFIVFLLGISIGTVYFPFSEVIKSIIFFREVSGVNSIITQIRLPRDCISSFAYKSYG